MTLHPDARAFLDEREAAGSRPVTELTVEEARAQSIRLAALLGQVPDVASVADYDIPGPRGPIPLRAYRPADAIALGDPPPALVWFHGGGWVLGNLETTDAVCRTLASNVPCVVVSVNYRHAPEHRWPAAADDCYAATAWVAANAEALAVDPARIAVGGQSAGGNLAAVVALMARDRGGPALVFQSLSVPVIDYNFDTASYEEKAEGYGLTRAAMQYYWDQYLAQAGDGAHPYASPLRADDLAGLPSAHVLTAEHDPLRDEGDAYADRLRQAGVPVTHCRYEGMIHGFLGAQAVDDMAAELRRAFAAE
ncbi:MAG: alpha/beta hydrolase [Anaerolineae bacterium]|nr:alpha/beta hydrolase [Anaerolineae bacterium]